MGFVGVLFFLIVALGVALALFRSQLYARLLNLRAPRYKVGIDSGIAVPTRDGFTLATDHYFPLDPGSFPTILIRSPYGRNRRAGNFGLILDFFVRRFVERGYHVVTQDVRGRFDSGGEFDPYFAERNDGLDTLDWLAKQPWFNGILGTWGSSYLGIVQWTLATASPTVKALVPAITASKLYEIIRPDGSFDLGLVLRWMAINQALESGQRGAGWRALPRLLRVERTIAPVFAELPLSQADERVVGRPVPFYRKWIAHPSPDDPLWQQMTHDMALGQLEAPAHLIGGWYDFFLRGLLSDYTELRSAGKKPYLTIGPWFHFSHSLVMTDSLRDGLDWFDAYLKGDLSRLRAKPVRLYMMGLGKWREIDFWPPPAETNRYYLDAGFRLRREVPPESVPADHYRYDPANPTPAVGGTQFSPTGGPRSNRELEARQDVLCYTSAPLDDWLEAIGPVCLELFAKSSLEFTDFFGRLCDVSPNGNSINVCDGLCRVSPGRGTCQPDGSLRVEIDMWATAYRFAKGHRIRLQVSSGAHPRWYRNLGIGDLTASDTTMQAADQTIYHDQAHPSALVLPVVYGLAFPLHPRE